MKIGIIPRPDLKEAVDLTGEIMDQFSDEEFLMASEVAEKFDKEGVPMEEMDVDSFVTIGGDGTVLYTLQKSPDTPILGINMGGRGFLADVNPKEAERAIEKLRKGELEILERKRLTVEISGEQVGEGLNEGVVRTKHSGRILSFEVEMDDRKVEKTEGDGLIVSSPTGSTAYGMSAGGPVIDPKIDAFVAVPLCTHRPRALPLVFPMSSTLKVKILECKRKADVTVDGQVTKSAGEGDTITFRKSDINAKFYKWKENFYEKLRKKL